MCLRQALIVTIVLAGCGASNPPRVDWPKVVSCAGMEVAALATQVAPILLAGGGSDMSAALEAQAIEHGAAAIACAVAQLVNEWSTAPAGQGIFAPEATPESDAAERGRQWLDSKDITVAPAPAQ
jgi:hypothetical protein